VVRRDGLNEGSSENWVQEMKNCSRYWNETGLPEQFSDAPFYRYDEYITENAREKLKVPR
jgi:hypothetical protein